MGNNVVIKKGQKTFKYENILGHQVGYGSVQVLERDGTNSIINNFDTVEIKLDDESRKEFEESLARQEAAANQPVQTPMAQAVQKASVTPIRKNEDVEDAVIIEAEEDEDHHPA